MIFSDFDGTITQVDVTDLILSELAHPSWQEVEQEWVCGSIGSRECLERQLALVETTEDQLNALIDSVPLDPHFARFCQFAGERGLPIYVVSDGFDYVVCRILKRAGVDAALLNGTHLFASGLRLQGKRLGPSFPHPPSGCEHGCATCKPGIIRTISRGRKPIIFVGDGLSDRFAVEASDVVFAKRQLLAHCRAKRIACHAFETFADVQAELEKQLTGDSQQLKGKAQEVKNSPRNGKRVAARKQVVGV